MSIALIFQSSVVRSTLFRVDILLFPRGTKMPQRVIKIIPDSLFISLAAVSTINILVDPYRKNREDSASFNFMELFAVFDWFNTHENTKREDEDTFVKRIRQEITSNTCATSGICVFEHEDESNLDDYEQKILTTLRKAHEEWMKKNPQRKATDRDHNGVDIERGLSIE